MVLVNGVPGRGVSASDRGLTYGDGVFRTLAVRGGSPQCWKRHYTKLREDCARLGIACPPESCLREEIGLVARERPDCAAKIIVTRGVSDRGYRVAPQTQPTRVITAAPLPVYPESFFSEGVKLHLCNLRLSHQPRLAGIKHLNRLENVLARQEWDDPEIPEGLFLDQEGNAIEGVASNLFMVKNDALVTPDLGRCGVAGVQRERIMDLAEHQGIPVKVQPIPLSSLFDAQEILLCNSLIGVWQVREFCGAKWGRGKLTGLLQQLLQKDDDQEKP
jgi:4-amino-4-deoxychorismate lyase